MKTAVVWVALSLAAGAARADVEADKRACADQNLSDAERVAACTRLIEDEGVPPVQRALALKHRGQVHSNARRYAQAIADFEKSLELDKDNPPVVRDLGIARFQMKGYEAAIADLTRATALDPRDWYTWYIRGHCFVSLKKYPEALADYGRALERSPRSRSVLHARSRLHLFLKHYPEASADSDAAIALDAYNAGAYFVRGRAHEESGRREQAFHDLSIALSLDPNLADVEDVTRRLAPKAAPGARTPVAWAAPAPGRTFTFLSTHREQVPPKDDMEKAIGELMGWFATQRKPTPTQALFLLREIGAEKDGAVTVKARYPFAPTTKAPVEEGDDVYAFWPAVVPFLPPDVLALDHDRAALASLWPLEPGKSASGKSSMTYTATAKPTQLSKMLSLKPGQKASIGTFTWKATVAGWEEVVVPAGAFDAIRVRDEQEIETSLFGRTQKQGSVVTHWYVPSLACWVKRVREIGQMLAVDEVVSVK